MLELCAFLHRDAVPEEMLVDGASYLHPLLETVVTNPLEFDRVIEDLLKFSFVKREPYMHSLHIVHRDLKPTNILVHWDHQVLLADFERAMDSVPKSDIFW